MHSKKILTLFMLFSSSLCLIAQSVTSLNLKIPTTQNNILGKGEAAINTAQKLNELLNKS